MVKNDMTAQNLRSAYAGESMAYQRYKVWGQKADEEGFENVALLFDAIAYAEEVHAGNHFAAHDNVEGDFLVAGGGEFGLGTTSENLVGAIEGEEGEVEQMYPTYSIVAKEQGESDAVRSFHYALEAEQIHAKLFRNAKEHVDNGEDIELEYVTICEVCGHTVVDGLPDKCPVCGEPSSAFRKFTK
ncbi:Rubrerythrin [Halanaerobium saccharolyticum subsp. saccharolyticum DSM 6643]|uniref:Rubrerythrin n=1 Tax=Halanaerobium saccharolyticum subsp. saccharolyticum DSM 6643 TaxID=1293054 RepID=M5E3C3_9FIRM|nr:rubrerythrin family protein [Halanaerobium saccharolyticum]CCU81087.1 Rubrerythrin [Halanaerobium saccharolyticum subsp. saccharolyticum DSM 6643]